MPYTLAQVEGGWKVRDETGKFYSEEPMPRKRAAAQMRALYANAPDAEPEDGKAYLFTAAELIEKKDVAGPMGVNASGPGGAGAIGLEKPRKWGKTAKHGSHDQKTHGQRWGMQGLRDYAKKSGLTVRTMQDGKIGIFGKKGDRTNMRATNITSAKKLIRSHNKWKRQGERDLARARRDSEERMRVIDQARSGKKPAKPKKQETPVAGARRNAQNAVKRMEGELSRARDLLKRTDASLGKRDNPTLRASRDGLAKDIRGMEAKIAEAKRKYQLKEALDVLLADDYVGESILESPGNLTVFKDSDDQYRWILQSSNAFRDRDNEIVSTKALEEDVEAADQAGSYGPLRWWHCKGYDLGDCDFRMVHGRTLIESGTFRSNEIGEAVKEHAGHLQVSIGFNHPANEPDGEGVFYHIRTFERSLLPAGKAANPFTRVIVKGVDEMATKEEKLKALRTLGIDPESVLQQAELTEKDLEQKGVAFKEAEAAAAEKLPAGELPETAGTPADKEAPAETPEEKAKKPAAEEDPEEEETEEPEEEEGEEEEEDVVGNMGKKEYEDQLRATVKEVLSAVLPDLLAPVLQSIHAHDPEEGKEAREKEASERAALKEQIDAQQGKIDALNAQLAATQTSLKESQDALTQAHAGLGVAAQTMKDLSKRLGELEGSQTRAGALGGYDAANDDSTVIDGERVKELGGPVIDPAASTMMDFTQNFLLGGNQ